MNSKDALNEAIITNMFKLLVSCKFMFALEKPCSERISTLNVALYTMFHHKTSFGCRFLLFAHLRNLGPFQWKQVNKTAHTPVLAEIIEFLAASYV